MQPPNKTVAILQPGYLPWLGFFDQVNRADIFILYDDVQYDKHGWRNRNRIKGPQGYHWLTVPVFHNAHGEFPILREARIDNKTSWAKKHLGTIRQYYSKAPSFGDLFEELNAILSQRWDFIAELDIVLITAFLKRLGITTPLIRSSELAIEGSQSGRLVNICHHFQATRYLSGDAAQSYLDTKLFRDHGMEVEWQQFKHPVYPQQYGEFLPYLSIIDFLMNCKEGYDGWLIKRGS